MHIEVLVTYSITYTYLCIFIFKCVYMCLCTVVNSRNCCVCENNFISTLLTSQLILKNCLQSVGDVHLYMYTYISL